MSDQNGDNGGNNVPAVNPQIVDAVQVTKSNVMDVAGEEGQAIAYQKVAQAAAFAVQDSTDYLRNIETMSTAAQGVALTLMIQTQNPFYLQVITAAQEAVTAAQTNFAAVGSAASTVATEFPSGS